jgi:hypothetical protein
VTARSYPKVLDKALRPLGFSRAGLEWVRVRGDMEEMVLLEPNRHGGRTLSFHMRDLETEKLYGEAMGRRDVRMDAVSERLGTLIDGYDRWWGNEPDGPDDMAHAAVDHGVPWFDRVRTVQDQAEKWYGRFAERGLGFYSYSIIWLGLSLYRIGEFEEALSILSRRVPRTAIPSVVGDVAIVRAWMEAKLANASCRGGSGCEPTPQDFRPIE